MIYFLSCKGMICTEQKTTKFSYLKEKKSKKKERKKGRKEKRKHKNIKIYFTLFATYMFLNFIVLKYHDKIVFLPKF